ncbi:MAG: DUF4249 domain-containing protein [Chitinophagales bacterium]
MNFKISYTYPIALLFLFFTVSCEKQFNTIVEVDIPELDNQIVINCIFNDTSFFQVGVYRSRGALNEDLNNPSFIYNATVELFADGNYVETLSLQENVIDIVEVELSFYQSVSKPMPNVVYTLQVSAPNLQMAKATAQLPKKVAINSAYITDTIFVQHNIPDIESPMISRYEIALDFQDMANQNNYYYLKSDIQYNIDAENMLAKLDIWRQTNPDTLLGIEDYIYFLSNEDNSDVYETCLYANDACFEETKAYSEFDFNLEGSNAYDVCYIGLNIFSDRLFENEIKNLDIQLEYIYNSLTAYFPDDFQTQYVLELGNVSQDMFLYQRSSQLQYNNEFNFFVEPIRVYSNIENGFGIFAGYHISTYLVE